LIEFGQQVRCTDILGGYIINMLERDLNATCYFLLFG